MKIPFVVACLLALASALRATSEHLVWFDTPAAHVVDALPLGNGRLGALLFGGVTEERIALNESGLWSGSPQNADRPDAHASHSQTHRLLLAGKNAAAKSPVNQNFTPAASAAQPSRATSAQSSSYQVLANLRLKFLPTPNHPADATPTAYRRELDLATATARLTYTLGDVTYTREAFLSAPDEALVLRLTASQPGALNFDVLLDRPQNFTTTSGGPDRLLLTGQLPDGKHGVDGVRYATRVRALMPSGDLSSTAHTLEIRDATQVVLLVTALTDIRSSAHRRADDPVAATDEDLARAAGKNHRALRATHLADYEPLFNRVSLRLGTTPPATAALATPARFAALNASAAAADPGLAALFFNFGRYLVISSSRPTSLPSPPSPLPPHFPAHHWPAAVCGLGEFSQPHLAYVDSVPTSDTTAAPAHHAARIPVASPAHLLNLWARLRDGDRCEQTLRTLLVPAAAADHFATTAGLAAMLLQSSARPPGSEPAFEIDLLPALPASWPEGEVKGLRARGGVTVDLAWRNGRVTTYRLTSKNPTQVQLRLNGETRAVTPDKI